MTRSRWAARGRWGRLLAPLAAVVPLGMLGAFALTGTAAAALPPGCSQSGIQVTCMFLYNPNGDHTQTWQVPPSVTSASFTLYGAQGGSGQAGAGGCGSCHGAGGAGGLGAKVTAPLTLTPGTVLQVNVGQSGGASASGAFGGGGAGGSGGSGGGASDIRIPASGGSYPFTNRLLVAGGGGGGGQGSAGACGGCFAAGGAGGNADTQGADGGSIVSAGITFGGGGGGGAGTTTQGGTAGLAGTKSAGADPCAGSPGSPGAAATTLGTGADNNNGGGGAGGGGYYGGGSGGSGAAAFGCGLIAGWGGGGGGASYPLSASTDGVAAPDGAPNGEVIITYTVPADLMLTDTASPSTVVSGNTYTYTVTATNTGAQNATGVVVTDTLPSSAHFVSATCARTPGGKPKTKNGTVTCPAVGLTSGGSVTLTITVSATKPGTIHDSAQVTATNVTDSPDGDDTGSAPVTVLGT